MAAQRHSIKRETRLGFPLFEDLLRFQEALSGRSKPAFCLLIVETDDTDAHASLGSVRLKPDEFAIDLTGWPSNENDSDGTTVSGDRCFSLTDAMSGQRCPVGIELRVLLVDRQSILGAQFGSGRKFERLEELALHSDAWHCSRSD